MTRGAASTMLAVIAFAPAVYMGASSSGLSWIVLHGDVAAETIANAPSVSAPVVAYAALGAGIAYVAKHVVS
jgi:hypothetical protein